MYGMEKLGKKMSKKEARKEMLRRSKEGEERRKVQAEQDKKGRDMRLLGKIPQELGKVQDDSE